MARWENHVPTPHILLQQNPISYLEVWDSQPYGWQSKIAYMLVIYIYIIHIPSCCAISIRKNWWSTTNNWGFFKGVGLVENRNTQCTHTRTSFYARDIFSCTYTHTSCYATDAICFTYSHTSWVATYIFSCTYPHTWCYARDIFSCTYHTYFMLRYKGFLLHIHTYFLLR